MKEDRKFNVLIVDDEELIRKSYLQYFSLESDELNLFQASSGNSALEVLAQNNIDFILSDVRMPDGDGIYLLDKIQQMNSPPPFLAFVTGYSELTREVAVSKGALDLFNKPVDLDQMLNLIKSTCLQIQ